jgi:hypothetical protein
MPKKNSGLRDAENQFVMEKIPPNFTDCCDKQAGMIEFDGPMVMGSFF